MLAYAYLGGRFIVDTPVFGMVVLCRHPLLAAAAWLIPFLLTDGRVGVRNELCFSGTAGEPTELREAILAILQSHQPSNVQEPVVADSHEGGVALPRATSFGSVDIAGSDIDSESDVD